MTCIVGLVKGGIVHLGADSLGADVATYAVQTRRKPKVFKKGEFVFGFTTSFRMGDILQYQFNPPEIPLEDDWTQDEILSHYMHTTFVEAVRTLFKASGFAKKENDHESGGEFMVGIRGRLFTIEPDYQIGETADNFDAIGSGMQIARGALFILQRGPLMRGNLEDIEACLRAALEAAEHCSAYVRGPYHFVSTEEWRGDVGVHGKRLGGDGGPSPDVASASAV